MLSAAFIHKLRAKPELQLAVLFGSMAAGTAGPESDIDLAVMGPRPLTAAEKVELTADLAEISGRPIDLIDLRTAGEPLLGQILRHGQRLLGDDTAWAALLSRHLIDAADFMPCIERLLAERRQQWIGK